MHPDDPLAQVLEAEVTHRARKLKSKLADAARGEVDAVHDSRTSLRRLRLELDIMARSGFEARQVEKIERKLSDAEKVLGKLRDGDVLLLDLSQFIEAHPQFEAELGPVHTDLTARRQKSLRRNGRGLDNVRSRKALKAARKLEHRPSDGRPTQPQPTLVRHVTQEEIWRCYVAVSAFDQVLPGDPEVLHRFRSSCRALRFTLELFEEVLPDAGPLIAQLSAVQDQIGQMHDHYLAARLLRKWRARGMLEASPGLTAWQKWHSDEVQRVRAEHEEQWLAVLGEDFRMHLAQAAEPPSHRLPEPQPPEEQDDAPAAPH